MWTAFRGRKCFSAWTLALILLPAAAVQAEPLHPASLRAVPVHGQRVDLSWQSSSEEAAEGYRVSRKCEGGDEAGYCLLADLGPDSRSYEDVTVQAGTAYGYRVESTRAKEKAAAFATAETWPETRLPLDESSAAGGPIYFEPQGAWSLGAGASLAGIKTVRIGHNLGDDDELGVLLRPASPVDSKAPCRQHSLLGRLSLADFKTEKLAAPSANPRPQTAEIYFYDLSQNSELEGDVYRMVPDFESMGQEGYSLRAEFTDTDALRIGVGAKTPRGLFRGGMTVQRLLVDDSLCGRRKELEPVVVLDYPDHPVRGSSPDWRPMTANYTDVPEPTLDMLDSLARSGANEVSWGDHWAAQEASSWDNSGARAAAAVQLAAAERFITVKYSMGGSGISFGTRSVPSESGELKHEMSLAQAVYGDGLGVVDEPFSWVETRPGHFEARAQRKGRLLDGDPGMEETPWVPDRCGWSQASDSGQESSWLLEGPGQKCRMSRLLPSGKGGGDLRAQARAQRLGIKASGDAVEVVVRVGFEVVMKDGSTGLLAEKSFERVPLRNGRWSEYVGELPASVDWPQVRSAHWVIEASLADGSLLVRDESPWHAAPCGASASWRHESAQGRDAREDSSWRLDGPARNCELSQVIEIGPLAGPYSLFGTIRSSADAKDVSGSMILELETEKGIREYPVAFSSKSVGEEWSRVNLDIPDLGSLGTVRNARLSVKASLGAGTLWLDSLALYARSQAPLSLDDESRANRAALKPVKSGLRWDKRTGRTDTGSFKVEIPMRLDNGARAQRLTLDRDASLEGGVYLLGAWVKARPADSTEAVPFDLKGEIRLFLHDAVTDQAEEKPRPVVGAYMSFPKSIEGDAGDWSYFSRIFHLSQEQARRVKSLSVRVLAFPSATKGEYWLDDIELHRLDGDVRNVLGAVRPPRLSRLSGELYEEGVDYAVCQIGVDASQCVMPQNYTDLLKGGLTSSYDIERAPFEIRWLKEEAPIDAEFLMRYDIGAQYETVSGPKRGWDGQVYTPGSLNFCEFQKVARGIELDTIFGRFLDGYTIKDFPEYGQDYEFKADVVTWGVSEVRGMNRSVACLGDDGDSRPSNASLFAEVVNEAVSLAKRKSPGVRFVLWADMFDPFANGGDREYQVRFGGVEGRSVCAYAPEKIASMCEDEIPNVPKPIIRNEEIWGEGPIMQPWTYFPNMIRRMVAISSWYEGLGVESQVLSGSDPINVEDWAGIAHAFGEIEGGLSNGYHSELYAGESGVLPGLQAFWNHDWRLVYLHDNETEESSFYQIPWPFEVTSKLDEARLDLTGACAAAVSKFDGNNDGGLCLEAGQFGAESTIDLDGIPVQGGARYRIDVLARRHPDRRVGIEPDTPQIRVRWSTGEGSPSLASRLIYQGSKRRRGDGFDRYRVEVRAPESAQEMAIEIEFPLDGGFSAADDVVVFESIRACFDRCSKPLQEATNRSVD